MKSKLKVTTKRKDSGEKKHSHLTISLIAVAVGLIFAFLLTILTGRSPFDLLTALVRSMTGFNLQNLGSFNIMYVLNWFLNAVPIIMTGLSVAFAYRTGLFNIGGEGQIIAGSTAAAAVALLVKLPPIIHPIACILAAAAAGALWGFLPGFLKAYRGINEVVICIMMNYCGMYACAWFTKVFLPIDPNTNDRTIAIMESAELKQVFSNSTSQFNWGFIVALLAVVLFWFVIEKTTFGYSLRATGFNKEAARFAGMKVERNITMSMMISGALTGIAGALLILGIYRYGRIFTSFDNFGFDGISVALVGGSTGIGVLLAGMLFGLFKAASGNLQLFNIPKEISELIQAIIIYLVAIQYAIVLLLDKISERKIKKKEIEEKPEGGNV
ncbi:ABC transporter permease [uncultured Traorella sp.]|uniref:ABC transporter permease n=1 Tax=uncultured Traorella sp. TaxID=1929048 RepID=UPI0025DA470F|nr:ABC transporter permease [uncultured Traorella sp.]